MKKVVFSLKSIALVAVASLGMVSCGDDDSAPAPTPVDPKLTENFVQVNEDQGEELANSIYAVHTSAQGNNAPVKVYQDQSGATFAGFYFISHSGSAATTFGDTRSYLVYYTPYDTTLPEEERLIMPYTQDGKTQFGGAITLVNDTQYSFASSPTLTLSNETSYATESAAGKLVYTLEGVDSEDATVSLKTNVNTPFDGLYGMYVPTQGSKMVTPETISNVNISAINNAKIYKR